MSRAKLFSLLKSDVAAVLAAGVLIAIILWAVYVHGTVHKDASKVEASTKDAAQEALKLMKDWGVWMASIQTGTLAALGIMSKDGLVRQIKFNALESWALIWAAIFNTVALFFSAWQLTATSSVMLRLYENRPDKDYDFYLYPLMNYLGSDPEWKFLTVGFVAAVNHWFWAMGVLAFGVLTVSLVVHRRPPVKQAPGENGGA